MPKIMFTKADLEKAFNASQKKRFDTGIILYPTFKDWYKVFMKSTRTMNPSNNPIKK